MKCNERNFKYESKGMEPVIQIDSQEISHSDYFHSLGSIIHKDYEYTEDMLRRIKPRWLKWRKVHLSFMWLWNTYEIKAKILKDGYKINHTLSAKMLGS